MWQTHFGAAVYISESGLYEAVVSFWDDCLEDFLIFGTYLTRQSGQIVRT